MRRTIAPDGSIIFLDFAEHVRATELRDAYDHKVLDDHYFGNIPSSYDLSVSAYRRLLIKNVII